MADLDLSPTEKYRAQRRREEAALAAALPDSEQTTEPPFDISEAEMFTESLYGLELPELRALLDEFPHAVAGYTPERLRHSIGGSGTYARVVIEALDALLTYAYPDEEAERDGFCGRMSVVAHLQALRWIADQMGRFQSDFMHVQETGYEAYCAKQQARRDRVRPVTAALAPTGAPAVIEPPPAPVDAPTVAANVKNQADERAPKKTDFDDAVIAMTFKVAVGHGVAPTSFLRSKAFTSQAPGLQLFRVLGMPNVHVERGERPLKESHLKVLIYLCSLVRDYDSRLGAEVKFRPRDAIKALGWSDNTESLKRLKGICEGLRATTLRIRHGDKFDTETAAALVASHTTSLNQRKTGWSATLPAALLNALQAFRTYVKFGTLAALPNGVPTMLYLFLRSEKSTTSEWNVQELTTVLGMTSTSLPERRRKLTTALEVLTSGVRTVKARGEALQSGNQAVEVVETKEGIGPRPKAFCAPSNLWSRRSSSARTVGANCW